MRLIKSMTTTKKGCRSSRKTTAWHLETNQIFGISLVRPQGLVRNFFSLKPSRNLGCVHLGITGNKKSRISLNPDAQVPILPIRMQFNNKTSHGSKWDMTTTSMWDYGSWKIYRKNFSPNFWSFSSGISISSKTSLTQRRVLLDQFISWRQQSIWEYPVIFISARLRAHPEQMVSKGAWTPK